MTAKELSEKMMELQRECNEKQSVLRKQYAIEHNPVKVGDLSDAIDSVEEITRKLDEQD